MASLEGDPYAPQAKGSLQTREQIALYYEQEFSSKIDPDQILLTTSTSEAYGYCFKLIADPGDSILIPQPSYPLLQFLIEAEGLRPKPYALHEADGEWILDRENLASACEDSTKAIIVVHPNNPTGHFLRSDDLNWLVEFSADRLWLISDEVFADYTWAAATQKRSLTQIEAPNAFTLSGLSKICALPQMKLGWVVMPQNRSVHDNLELVADTYLSVSGPIQKAAACWLPQRAQFQSPIRERCLANLKNIPELLNDSHWSLLPVEAGWMAILKGPANRDEEGLVLQLLEKGFSVHPGFYYDLPFQNSLAISLLTPSLQLASGIQA
ncbi:MAG: pyridoxal phosphate-dependent aminotransferase, partial [Acidobacteria bacterium]|nr:pyridoxal phosphate-dependent aminotransferase [Acidobacteriota bacterium]